LRASTVCRASRSWVWRPLELHPNVPAIFRQCAGYVDKILKGAKPYEQPVQRPTKIDLIVDLKIVKTRITIPPSISHALHAALLSPDDLISENVLNILLSAARAHSGLTGDAIVSAMLAYRARLLHSSIDMDRLADVIPPKPGRKVKASA
jgi:hypothetical protein